MFKVLMVLVFWCTIYKVSVKAGSCQGTCVAIACDKNKVLSGDESPEFNLRLETNECGNLFEVCCPTTSVTHLNLVSSMGAGERCGIRNDNGIGFHITGNNQGESQYEPKDVYEGSASLISSSAALTAAHIVKKAQGDELFVRAGEWDLNGDNELLPIQNRQVVKTIVHEKYNEQHHNNIALLILKEPFDLDKHVRPICLPSPTISYNRQSCLTGGWGDAQFNDKTMVHILKKVQVPLMERDQCEVAFRTTRLGSNFHLDQSYVCAGGEENVDVCTGDGGAPLICPDSNGIYYQIGIVAWGIGCGEQGIPGAYTNVAFFSDWIEGHLKSVKIFE
ncbi:phenoloxidase-activating factor 2-like [Sabethes cyaneus]|uniref:phenoloxidase-activating factor 2-like n=1 Tax=Sabethes cyaneus TaxID=53552 RepID=UPI00237D6667|nr:phenoloxidase-activating factor 2-like [Sabethes cyaneus]